MRKSIEYFDQAGPQNTQSVIRLVKERLEEGDIRDVVVASESGRTALAVAEALGGTEVKLTAVCRYGGHRAVHRRPGQAKQAGEMDSTLRDKLASLGIEVLDRTPWIFKCTFDSAFLKQTAPNEIVHRFVSRCFGFGIKTCLEVALIAADSGAVESGSRAVTIAGTGWLGGGADSALVVRCAPVFGGAFLKCRDGLEVLEVLALPRMKFPDELIERMKKAGKEEP